MNEKTNAQIAAMKNQTIGVEVEMYNITRQNACNTIAAYFHTENTVSHDGGSYDSWSCQDTQGRTWKITRDVSIQAACDTEKTEMGTPILNYSDIEDLQEIIRQLRHAGAKSDPAHMLTVIAAFAQAESEGASDNARLTYKRKFKDGIPASGLERTFGYKKSADGGITVDEQQAATVRLIFSLAAQGIWPSKIRGYLNERDIPNGTATEWSDSSVFRILHNPSYKGDLVLQKTYLDGRRKRHKNEGQADQWYIADNHQAIVLPEQWDAVQCILAERSKQLAPMPPQKPQERRSCRNQYPLTNKLYCPFCGAKLHHRWSNGGKQEYWTCSTNLKVSASACKGVSVPASIANGWGDITEPVTVIAYKDKYGMRQFTAYPKDEYEASEECPYQKGQDDYGKRNRTHSCTSGFEQSGSGNYPQNTSSCLLSSIDRAG